MQVIEHSYIRKFATKRFNKLAFAPSDGASGGILMGWNSTISQGDVLHNSKFSITINFAVVHTAKNWKLSTIYGPCQSSQMQDFVD
jgi:hypothetical protein